jgi:hypothetical protein
MTKRWRDSLTGKKRQKSKRHRVGEKKWRDTLIDKEMERQKERGTERKRE